MAGQVHFLIKKLIEARSKGNSTIASTTQTKLLLKGIKTQDWTPASPDDQGMLTKVRSVAKEMGITL